jgi:hypothetical protein
MNHDEHVLANMAAEGPLDCERAGCEGGLPEPDYSRDGITLYHGDCRDILPHLPPVDGVPFGNLFAGLVQPLDQTGNAKKLLGGLVAFSLLQIGQEIDRHL